MSPSPREPRLVHPLPPTPCFVGRGPELAELTAFWTGGGRGVLALVGLGGAGKTAVAARFLEALAGPGPAPRPGSLFVWSFYQEPDAGLCLQEAYRYFAPPGADVPAKGLGLLHLLQDVLKGGGPHLIVLDGLERVQRQADSGSYGQVEDPLLKALLVQVADGALPATVLITSRFPLTDLGPLQGRGYRHIDVGGLDRDAALALLRKRGVRGDDATLLGLVEAYGAHALTLDHLGGLIGQFRGGDPGRAPELPAMPAAGADRQALRLARLLRAYEEHLPAAEKALLCRLCLLRRSMNEEQVLRLFLCTPPVRVRSLKEVEEALLHAKIPAFVQAPELVSFTEQVRGTIAEFLDIAPLAGPPGEFQAALVSAFLESAQLFPTFGSLDAEALLLLYRPTSPEIPTDQRPLSASDRQALRELASRYRALREHPLNTYKEKEPAPSLNIAFDNLGWNKPKPRPDEDMGPADVMTALGRVERRLRHLAIKHTTLVRVRQLCRFHQRKWALAGALAPLSADELRQVLQSLVDRRLLLREADGAFSVHPAVRDHFGRLAAQDQGEWHDLIREQLITLVQRPGRHLPEDRVTLDLVEEAIHHAGQAGRHAEAAKLYQEVLGGLRHLGWKLGEMARGLRVLRSMQPCPNRWALAWFLRALGELDEAHAHNELACFRADVRLLQGRLPLVAPEGDDTRTAAAAFLMGESGAVPSSRLACAVPRALVFLYLGRLKDARRATRLEDFYRDVGWEGDRARCQLLRAEAARRLGNADECRANLDAAAGWVLHSGSVEHLCLLHLVRARWARDAGDGEAAQRAVSAGLHLARPCGLALYHIELLCAQAEVMLDRADVTAAEAAAGEALWRATAADCRFAWGEAEASHLLGRTLAGRRHGAEARTVLEKALALRRRIGDPRAAATEHLLATLP